MSRENEEECTIWQLSDASDGADTAFALVIGGEPVQSESNCESLARSDAREQGVQRTKLRFPTQSFEVG